MDNLHAHNLELYNEVQKYIHNQTAANAIALVTYCQREGGKFTGYYPTNYVSQEDIESAVNDEEYENLTHEEMKQVAEAIGEQDTENGTYWATIGEWYYDVKGR